MNALEQRKSCVFSLQTKNSSKIIRPLSQWNFHCSFLTSLKNLVEDKRGYKINKIYKCESSLAEINFLKLNCCCT